jgi:hypothetical protein
MKTARNVHVDVFHHHLLLAGDIGGMPRHHEQRAVGNIGQKRGNARRIPQTRNDTDQIYA